MRSAEWTRPWRSAGIRQPARPIPTAIGSATSLTREQIEALPDDPDEMERMLTEMAGPGGAIRVDGFRGGRLPPKSQIRSIRFTSGMFAAENHGGGMMFVDISTAPGLGPLRGSFDMSFRDDSLNARNAFQERKGPERNQQYTLNLSGTLRKERTSFSLSAGGAAVYDSANIYAATGAGTQAAAVRRPSDRINFTGRIDHAINRSHTLRAMYQQNDNDQRNLGIGSFDLSERAFGRRAFERMLRLSESGPLAKAWFGEMRLQLRTTESDSLAALEQPTIRVLDAFTAGGAQQDGGRRANEVEWATNVDWARGRHAIRFGSLVEGGSLPQRPAHQLSRHLHVREPCRLRGRHRLDVFAARRQPAGRILALAGRPVRAGRLARPQEPDVERRIAPGDPDAPRRRMEPGAARRADLVAVQERAHHRARRRRRL